MKEAREQKNSLEQNQKKTNRSDVLVKDRKIYFPISLLSKEFSYDVDHIARLARQDKVDGIHENKKWYITRESLVVYKERAKQNKIAGGLKSTAVISHRLRKNVFEEPEHSSGDEKVLSEVLFKNGTSLIKKDESKIVLSHFDDTQDSDKSNLSFIVGEYLLKAHIKIASRAKFLLAVFLIFIASGAFILIGKLSSNPLSEKIIFNNIDDYEENSQLAKISVIDTIDFLKNLFKLPIGPGPNLLVNQNKEKLAEPEITQQTERKIIPSFVPSTTPTYLPAISQLPPLIQNYIDELSRKIETLAIRINEIPSPLKFYGGSGGGMGPQTVSTDTNNKSVKTEGLTVSGSGSIGTTLTVATDFTVDTNTFYVDSTNNRVGILTTTPETAFEVVGVASVSQFAGAGLTDCDSTTQSLKWDETNKKFSCGSGGVSSNSLDFDEMVNAMTLDTNTTITGGAFALTFDHASVSTNFEVIGNASASAFLGSAFSAITANCNTESDTLLWNSSTGKFFCGVDSGAGSATYKTEEGGATILSATNNLNFD
ncbi:MAG: hypothetical protein AAB461_03050, partial [Patescibacteria group bacterium]